MNIQKLIVVAWFASLLSLSTSFEVAVANSGNAQAATKEEKVETNDSLADVVKSLLLLTFGLSAAKILKN